MTNSVIGDGNQVSMGTTAPSSRPAPPPAPSADVQTYDLAFSFAGEDREYVEAVKHACDTLGLVVMYDRDLSTHWWGRNYLVEQRRIYAQRTRFVVPFISSHYFAKPIPQDEFAAAMWTDIRRGGGYLLPVLIGQVEVPVEQLPAHVGCLRAEEHTPDQLAAKLAAKVAEDRRAPQEIGGLVPHVARPHPGW
ncbi:MAG TPA: toll/interleukin-1 receptor domain-containing protein [Pseudonocardiaceae bacterium]|nr:toll/interleukin-1 receptor domain-containing protein [Pseudonocardiaceae bacterium]